MSAKTHDYTRRKRGHDFTILKVADEGKQLHAAGWGEGVAAGDYLILPNEGRTTRYAVASVSYYADPPDMWMARLTFAPRPNEVGT